MPKRPTVYDVAKDAGVSIATVSFAFAKPERVKQETLHTVLASAARLGYVPSGNARGLAKGRTGALGLYAFDYLLERSPSAVQSDLESDLGAPEGRLFPLYSDEVQRGVQLECRQRGYALMLGSGGDSPNRARIVDVAGRVDGLIAFAHSTPPVLLRQLAQRIPVVQLGGDVQIPDIHTVHVNGHAAMSLLVEHLLTVHGYREFVYIGSLGTPEFNQRYDGFAERLHQAGLIAPEPTASTPALNELTALTVRQALTTDRLPEVLVCATDQEALAALDTVRETGLRVPEDIAVTGFDGIIAARLSDPPLTTVRQPMETIGRTAVRMVTAMIDGAQDVSPASELHCRLSIGRSCGCLT